MAQEKTERWMVAQTMHGMADSGQEVSLKPDGLRGIARLLEEAESPSYGRFFSFVVAQCILGWLIGVWILWVYDNAPLTKAPVIIGASMAIHILTIVAFTITFLRHKKV